VWGGGHGIVTVRFESRHSGPGPVRSLPASDAALHAEEPEPLDAPVA
jgi:DNA polymerase-4